MNNKKNINVDQIKVGNNEQSSLSELEYCTKNKETFNFLNKKQSAFNIIRQRIKSKDNNKLIFIPDKEKIGILKEILKNKRIFIHQKNQNIIQNISKKEM
jgi:hypothetical protein